MTTTVEGRERYSVIVRYPRDLRNNPEAIASQVLVPTASGAMIPLGQIASIGLTQGPPSLRTENAQLVAYVYVDMRGLVTELRDLVSDIKEHPKKYFKVSVF